MPDLARSTPAAIASLDPFEVVTETLLGSALVGSMQGNSLRGTVSGEGCLIRTTRRVVLWACEGSGQVWSESQTILLDAQPVSVTVGSGSAGAWVVVGSGDQVVFGLGGLEQRSAEAFASAFGREMHRRGGRVSGQNLATGRALRGKLSRRR